MFIINNTFNTFYLWLYDVRPIQIAREETCCCHMGYSFRLTARVILYAPPHRQDSTYHGLCCTSRGALAGTRNSSMGPPHEGSIRRPIAPWANALPLSYVPLLSYWCWWLFHSVESMCCSSGDWQLFLVVTGNCSWLWLATSWLHMQAKDKI